MFFGGEKPSAAGVKKLLTDTGKVKDILPILEQISDTYKEDGEYCLGGWVAFEDGKPMLRIVATRIEENEENGKELVITRNLIDPSTDQPIKFDLLELLIGHNEEEENDQ